MYEGGDDGVLGGAVYHGWSRVPFEVRAPTAILLDYSTTPAPVVIAAWRRRDIAPHYVEETLPVQKMDELRILYYDGRGIVHPAIVTRRRPDLATRWPEEPPRLQHTRVIIPGAVAFEVPIVAIARRPRRPRDYAEPEVQQRRMAAELIPASGTQASATPALVAWRRRDIVSYIEAEVRLSRTPAPIVGAPETVTINTFQSVRARQRNWWIMSHPRR